MIELASVHDFSPGQREFLQQIMMIIGTIVNTAESRGRMKQLLEQTAPKPRNFRRKAKSFRPSGRHCGCSRRNRGATKMS